MSSSARSAIKPMFVGFSTMLVIVAIASLSLIGISKIASSPYVLGVVIVPLGMAVLLQFIRVFTFIFCDGMDFRSALRCWKKTLGEHLYNLCSVGCVVYPAAVIALCFFVGTFSFVGELRRDLAVARDAEATIAVRTAEMMLDVERLEKQVEALGYQITALSKDKQELEGQVEALSTENAKLRGTIKKASAVGVVSRNFDQPPR